jgi:hypothetical protein
MRRSGNGLGLEWSVRVGVGCVRGIGLWLRVIVSGVEGSWFWRYFALLTIYCYRILIPNHHPPPTPLPPHPTPPSNPSTTPSSYFLLLFSRYYLPFYYL